MNFIKNTDSPLKCFCAVTSRYHLHELPNNINAHLFRCGHVIQTPICRDRHSDLLQLVFRRLFLSIDLQVLCRSKVKFAELATPDILSIVRNHLGRGACGPDFCYLREQSDVQLLPVISAEN